MSINRMASRLAFHESAMSDFITDGQTLVQWLTEGLFAGQHVQASKWVDLWTRLVDGGYTDAQAELLFQRIIGIGRDFGALGTFRSRASEGRRIWRYSRLHRNEALALLQSGTGYHKIIAQMPTKNDTSWRKNRTSLKEESLAMISELNEFELSALNAYICQLLSARKH